MTSVVALLSDVLQDLFPKQRQNSRGSTRSIGKAIKRNPRKTCPSSSRHGLDTLLTTKIIEVLCKCNKSLLVNRLRNYTALVRPNINIARVFLEFILESDSYILLI